MRTKNNTKNEVETIVANFGSSIEEWVSPTSFIDEHGCDGYIFKSNKAAVNSILYGENKQNALDYVSGALTDEDWIQYLINGGVDEKIAKKIIKDHNWYKVVKIIVETSGPEWFLANYSGKIHFLNNGSLLYY